MSTDSEFANDFGYMRVLADGEDRSRTPRSWDVVRASAEDEAAQIVSVPVNVSKDLPLAPGERVLFGKSLEPRVGEEEQREFVGDAAYYVS